tara:strand:- start:3484 stop:3738 length:255 start_codon:yes stop_codon:yes gene_type:complete
MQKPNEAVNEAQALVIQLKREVGLAAAALRQVEKTMESLEGLDVEVVLQIGHSATIQHDEVTDLAGDLENAELEAKITLKLESF